MCSISNATFLLNHKIFIDGNKWHIQPLHIRRIGGIHIEINDNKVSFNKICSFMMLMSAFLTKAFHSLTDTLGTNYKLYRPVIICSSLIASLMFTEIDI